MSNGHKNVNHDKYDMLTNKSFRFLFYGFNDYPDRRSLPVQYARHIVICEDIHELLELQKNDLIL